MVNARLSRVPGVLGIATTLAIAVAPPVHAADAVRLIVKLKSDAGKSAFTAKARVEKLGADTGTPIRHVRSMAMDAEVVALDGVSPTDTAQALERLRVRPESSSRKSIAVAVLDTGYRRMGASPAASFPGTT